MWAVPETPTFLLGVGFLKAAFWGGHLFNFFVVPSEFHGELSKSKEQEKRDRSESDVKKKEKKKKSVNTDNG